MAKVTQTDADVYLQQHASIFMYHTQSRALYYAWYNGKTKMWDCFRNGKKIDEMNYNRIMMTHYELQWIMPNCDPEQDNYIKGRISPSGAVIYIHDMASRTHRPAISRRFDYAVDKAIRKVHSYMNQVIN